MINKYEKGNWGDEDKVKEVPYHARNPTLYDTTSPRVVWSKFPMALPDIVVLATVNSYPQVWSAVCDVFAPVFAENDKSAWLTPKEKVKLGPRVVG